jgi:hypothetical protein
MVGSILDIIGPNGSMMTDSSLGSTPQVPPESHAAVVSWMKGHGWNVGPPRGELDPEIGFHVWQEDEPPIGRSHALWIAESMLRTLSAEQLIAVLNSEGIADEIRISFKVRIEERGDEYRVSVVPRRSGEIRRQD